MKNLFKLVCIYLLIILVQLQVGLFAQEPESRNDATFHNRKYFLKMEKARMENILKTAGLQQDKETSIIKRISRKNDSLLHTGNIYDSVSSGFDDRLKNEQRRIDSLIQRINSLQMLVSTLSGNPKQYLALQSAIAGIEKLIKKESPLNEYHFRRINEQLDSFNLSGEKGRLKGMLNSASAQQEKEAVKIEEIGNKKDSLLGSGNVEPSVSLKIDNRLQTYQRRMDSIGKEIKVLQQKLNSPKEFTKEFRFIKTKIILIDSVVNKNASAREYIFRMIDDGLSKSKKNLFNLAAFFGPGGFIIPETKYEMATRYFSPVVDSLVKFSNNYASVVRTASIIVNGYADATSISSGSKLYKTLSAYLNKTEPGKEELNAALSALRAEEISKFLNKILKERFPDFKSIDKIVFETVEEGQGEKFPDQAITNYMANDERRRVVIIFWSILPNQ